MRKLLFWSLCGATLAVYLVMALWSLPTVSAGAGGLAPFDMRPGGYSEDEARAFMAAITPEASAFYRDVQQKLDLVYPTLAALTLFFALSALLPAGWGTWRYVFASPAVLVGVFDYLENHAVAGLLLAGRDATPTMIADASQWTVLKAVSTTFVASALLLLLLWRGVMVLRRRFRQAA